jgi:formate-dependent nitrite reductase cytochrome c552 subunit
MRAVALFIALHGLATVGCGSGDEPRAFAARDGAAAGEVDTHIPERLTSIETGETDPLGRPLRIRCASCHSVKAEAAMPSSPADLREFHVGLSFSHGALACSSCHVSEPLRAPQLHLADGTRLPMTEAMRLCAQCHGPQLRDYEAGAHGGMRGAWDRSRGGRVRNHCVDCHDPHVPGIRPVLPAERARDRIPMATRHGAAHGS